MAENRTCIECGFLTIQGRELSRAERIMLASHGTSAVMPADCEQTQCFKGLWVEYDLIYAIPDFQGVRKEIERNRDDCPGFMPYEAGFTPEQHLEIQLNAEKLLGAQEETKEVGAEGNEPTSFKHSPDFRSINKNDKEFTLTFKQAEVVRILWEAQKTTTPDLGQAYIIEKVSPDTSTKRLRDIFKGNLEAWKALIEPGNRRGTFRLRR